MNKKGSLMKMMGITFGIILFIIATFAFGLFMFGLNYSFNKVTTQLESIESPNNITNISYYAGVTFGNLNSALGQFKWMSYALIFSMLGGVIVSCFLVRMHPAWSILYILMSGVFVTLSIFVARGYENIYSGTSEFALGLQSWEGYSFVVLHLPQIVGLVAVFGIIPLFINLNKDREQLGN